MFTKRIRPQSPTKRNYIDVNGSHERCMQVEWKRDMYDKYYWSVYTLYISVVQCEAQISVRILVVLWYMKGTDSFRTNLAKTDLRIDLFKE